jgi:predicted Zn-dependent protease
MTETTTAPAATTPAEKLFDSAIKDYQAGESPAKLIPVFIDICKQSPKLASAWTCLSWLHLLENQPELAFKAAQKAVKIEPYDAQSRINLALAMLDTKKPGVREHIEVAQQMMNVDTETHDLVFENIKDGLTRKPDWASYKRIEKWLLEE